MPRVSIAMNVGQLPEFRSRVGDIVHLAMVDVLKVPADDKFQIIAEHPDGGIRITDSYLGISHGDQPVLIQITLNQGRTVQQKKDFYSRIARDLDMQLGVRPEDVIINLIEVAKENWSFGNGLAPYADH
jgi:4-oxalocrotonate tautomerase